MVFSIRFCSDLLSEEISHNCSACSLFLTAVNDTTDILEGPIVLGPELNPLEMLG